MRWNDEWDQYDLERSIDRKYRLEYRLRAAGHRFGMWCRVVSEKSSSAFYYSRDVWMKLCEGEQAGRPAPLRVWHSVLSALPSALFSLFVVKLLVLFHFLLFLRFSIPFVVDDILGQIFLFSAGSWRICGVLDASQTKLAQVQAQGRETGPSQCKSSRKLQHERRTSERPNAKSIPG